MANRVPHYEIDAEEPATLAECYRNQCGWQIEHAPGIDSWRIQTGTADREAIRCGFDGPPDSRAAQVH